MTTKKDNVPAAPDTTATPPATETGAGTSVAAAPIAAPDDKPAELPLGFMPQRPASEPLGDADTEDDVAPEEPQGPEPGSADFDAEAPGVSAFEIEEHIRILKARKKLKALNNPVEKPAPVPVTVVDATASEPAPIQPKLVTKVDKEGQRHSLPQATWDALGAKRLAEYQDVEPQPAKPTDV